MAALGTVVGLAQWLRMHHRSAAVSTWQRSGLPRRWAGDVSCLVGGAGHDVALLIHGLVATGDVFGQTADRLAESHLVVVPDLPGFGRSLDAPVTPPAEFDMVGAVENLAEEFAVGKPLVLAAHSMGTSVALEWAASNPVRVREVICLGAPVWSSPHTARRAIGAAGPMARVFILDERIARLICRCNCDHRRMAGWIAVILAPRWPVPIARQASLHTWLAYRRAFNDHVLDVDWRGLLHELDRDGVKVSLVWGAADPVGDVAYAERLTADLPNVSIQILEGADHTLPSSHPEFLVERLSR